mgnify:CR=1 FL=1
MAMVDTPEMAAEREAYVPLDVVKCPACGRVWMVRRGTEDRKCVCGAEAK